METIDPQFRLFITCLPHKDFPLGLLQMSTKVTNEPPMGLKAGLLRTYTVTVDQERLERVETEQWRKLLFGLSLPTLSSPGAAQVRRDRLVHQVRI